MRDRCGRQWLSNVVKVMTHLECLLGVVKEATLPSGLTQNREGFYFRERIHNFVNESSYRVRFTRSFTAALIVHDRPNHSQLRLTNPPDPSGEFSTDPLFSVHCFETTVQNMACLTFSAQQCASMPTFTT